MLGRDANMLGRDANMLGSDANMLGRDANMLASLPTRLKIALKVEIFGKKKRVFRRITR
jgi:uncharacterized Fe-S cluster-containing radical SAM superfamily protein